MGGGQGAVCGKTWGTEHYRKFDAMTFCIILVLKTVNGGKWTCYDARADC